VTPVQRIKWIVAGVLLAFLVFELGFRLLGGVFLLAGRLRSAGTPYERTILCEGDSFTYGIGGQDFPHQLEEILNERAGRRVYRTVNKGVPGLSTALLADGIEEHLDRYRPETVIIVAGENNSWNSVRLAGEATSVRSRAHRLLLHSRVYKFVAVAFIGLRHPTFHDARGASFSELQRIANHITEEGPSGSSDAIAPEGREFLEKAQGLASQGRYEEALSLYLRYASIQPDIPLGLNGAANCQMRLGRLDDAIAMLEKAARLPRTAETENTFFALGWTHQRKGDSESAVRAWQEGLRLFPGSQRLYQSMARILHEGGRLWEALDLAERVPRVRENPLHRFLAEVEAREGRAEMSRLVRSSMKSDVRRICEAAASRGVRVIFASYPDALIPEIAETAAENGATFIDFRRVFRERFSSREEYISADNCHCSSEGYRVMAEAFADAAGPSSGRP